MPSHLPDQARVEVQAFVDVPGYQKESSAPPRHAQQRCTYDGHLLLPGCRSQRPVRRVTC